MEAKHGAGPKPEAEQLKLLSPDAAPRTHMGTGRRGTRVIEDAMLRARNQADGSILRVQSVTKKASRRLDETNQHVMRRLPKKIYRRA